MGRGDLRRVGELAEPWQTIGIAAWLFAACVVTYRLSPWAERLFGEEDSGKFVTDEVAGFLMTVLLFRPPSVSLLVIVLWAFPVTRIIDMIKPPPARRLEHLPGGWGVSRTTCWIPSTPPACCTRSTSCGRNGLASEGRRPRGSDRDAALRCHWLV